MNMNMNNFTMSETPTQTYTINLTYENSDDKNLTPNFYLCSDYTTPNNPYAGISYSHGELSNLTSIEMPTNNPKLITAAIEICKEIEEKILDLDNLIQGIIELNNNPNIHM